VAAVLRELPDTPRWVEGRGMLLAGRGVLAGTATCPLAFAPDEGLAVALASAPTPAGLAAALLTLDAPPEAVVVPAGAGLVGTAVEGWIVAGAMLFGRPPGAPLPEPPGGVAVGWIEEQDLGGHVPADLAEELRGALARVPVAATFAEGRAVSFCYAGWETETLWDVSIDTLAPWRGKGYAAHAAAAAIRLHAGRGLAPVWGALDGNEASIRVGKKLGFTPVDRIAVMAPTAASEGLTPAERGR
jgi:GNAT superfamily N-acetyltransferase